MLCPHVNRSHLHPCLLSPFFFLKIAGKLRINPASPLAFVTLAASIQSALRSIHDRMTVTEIAAIRAKVDSPPKKVDASEKYALLAYATNTESVIFPARFAVKNRQNGNLIIPIGTMYTSSGSGVIEKKKTPRAPYFAMKPCSASRFLLVSSFVSTYPPLPSR